MATLQINRENRYFSSDGHYVCSKWTPNGFTAEIEPNESIRFYGNFIYFDQSMLEQTSKDYTDRTYKVGSEVNVLVGRRGEIARGQLLKINESYVTIKPHGAKTSKRVPLFKFSAMNRA